MNLKLEVKDFEEEARALCVYQGVDPDSREMYPHPEGYAVARYRAAWTSRAILLHQQWMVSGLVSRTLRRLGL